MTIARIDCLLDRSSSPSWRGAPAADADRLLDSILSPRMLQQVVPGG
jgi:hypothetical protein